MKKRNELLKTAAVSLAVMFIIYLFYRSAFVLLALPPVVWIIHRELRKDRMIKNKNMLTVQFKDMLVSLTAALRAGYSVENGLRETLREMRITHGEGSEICRELLLMLNQLNVGLSAEEVFREFGERSDIEDIKTFAEIFSAAKRGGGDMVEIFRKTAADISEKTDTGAEIGVLISAKKLERNIMLLMPPAIIVYIDLTSSDLLDPLYGNAAGVAIMTTCLALYGAAWALSGKIIKIEV